MSQPTPIELKNYITADTGGLGLSTLSDLSCSRELNRQGAIAEETVIRELVNTADIMTALYSDVNGLKDLTIDEKSTLNLLSPVGSIDPTALQAVFLDMFPSGGVRGPIRDALIALAVRPASPAEKEWGRGITISSDEVEIARRDG